MVPVLGRTQRGKPRQNSSWPVFLPVRVFLASLSSRPRRPIDDATIIASAALCWETWLAWFYSVSPSLNPLKHSDIHTIRFNILAFCVLPTLYFFV
jgi:hypothetical protein